MPRIGRKYLTSQYVHIITQGINQEYIFLEDKYKDKYLNLIKSNFEKYNHIKLLVYCIMDNHVHLLIYHENGEDLSKAMAKINTSFAIYYNTILNRVGHVFRNRFYSRQIIDEKQLYNTVTYIHRNPIKAGITKRMNEYKYSSYNSYRNKTVNLQNAELLFNTIEYIELFEFVHEKYLDEDIDDIKEEFNSDEIYKMINKFCINNKISIEDIKKDNILLLKLVDFIQSKFNCQNKQIQEIIGIGKNRICEARKKISKEQK